MTSHLLALRFDAHDPSALAEFWGALLGWEAGRGAGSQYVELLPTDDTGFRLRFEAATTAKVVANQMHFDLTSDSPEQQRGTVARALALGATHLDVGQRPEEGHVVLADPEGNEFCVLAAGNAFLADCGFLGAVAGDGSEAVGRFWAAALGWPLVWDVDGQTAIRAPAGGPKFTWGGPPLAPRAERSRVRLELGVAEGGDGNRADRDGLDDEVARLVGLGATCVSEAEVAIDRPVVLLDPDGNEFRLSPDSSPTQR